MTFALILPSRIRFGRDALAEATAELAALGPRPLVLHAPSAAARAGTLAHALHAEGSDPALAQTPPGEPDLPGLRALLDAHCPHGHGAVIAIGGGTALDMGKALAALLPAATDPLVHLEVVGEGRPLDAAPLPFAAIPTTSGTGSEATVNAVIGVPEAARKVSLRDPRMMARLAVVDPALTEGVPVGTRLASGLDAVVQVIEPYLSTRAGPLTDALCRDAIPRGLRAIRAVMDAPTAAAFDEMALTSLTGGIALANAGLGAVHGLAGVVGGRTGAPHGAICGRLLVPVLRRTLPALDGSRGDEVLGWIAAAFGDDPLDAFEAWIDAHALPRLTALGVRPEDRAAIADASAASSSMRTHPVPLSAEDLARILADA